MPAGIETTDLSSVAMPSIAMPSAGPFGSGATNITTGPFAPEGAATDDGVDSGVDDSAPDTSTDNSPADPATDGKEVNYDDAEDLFAEISSTVERITAKPKPAVADDSSDDTDDTDDDIDPAPVPPKAKSPTPTNNQSRGKFPPKPRDYSDLSPEDAQLARNMGGRSFDRFRDAIKELKVTTPKVAALEKELSTLKADSTLLKGALDHPDAYVLTPEYSEASSTYNLASQEVAFIQDQLARAHDGRACKLLKKTYNAQGQLQYSTEDIAQPTAAVVAQLTNDQQSANIRLHQASQTLTSLPARHAQARQQFITEFNTFQSKAIEPLWNGFKADPAIAPKAEAMEKGLLAQIPSHMRRNELAPALARSLALVFLMAERKAGELNKSKQTEFSARERKAAGIVKSSPRGGNTTGGDIYDGVSDDEFLDLKNR